MRFRLSLYVLLLLAVSAPVFCQQPDLTEKSLEELMNITVSTASKHEQLATEAPASVTVITADEIHKYGYRTLGDILRSVRGFYVTYDRNYSYLGVRGFGPPGDYNTRMLLLIDGHRLNDNVYDQAMIGSEFPLSMGMIERIEVIRGPSSSLYGSNAFFGVINVITRKSGNVNGVETSVSAGSYGSYQGQATYGTHFHGVDFIFSGTAYDSRGQNLFFSEFNSPETNYGMAMRADDDQVGDYFGAIGWRGFTLEGLYSSREKGIPTAPYTTAFDVRGTRTTDGHRYLDLSYEHKLAGQWDFSARAFYDEYRYDGSYIYPGKVLNIDVARGEWWGTELKLQREFLRKHRVTAGTEFRDNLRQWQANYDVQPFYSYLDDNRNSVDWAAYLQDEFTIRPDLTLNAGIRYDRYGGFKGTTNPRLGLIYQRSRNTTVKLLYGTAFRAPNVYELYYYAPGFGISVFPVRPETIRSTEAVFERRFAQYFCFTFAGYYNWIKNLIAQQADASTGNITYRNLPTVAARGVEFELAAKLPRGLESRASYALQDTRHQLTDELVTNSPRHLGKFNLVVPLVREKLFTGIEAQYTSRRRTVQGTWVGGFPVFNLTLFSARVVKLLDLSASVYNLFDKDYSDPGGEEHLQRALQQDGRNFRLKLTWRWGQR